MTQKGFKRFQRRRTQDRLQDPQLDAASIPQQEAKPLSGVSETGASDDTTMPEVDTGSARYLSQSERTGDKRPGPQPDEVLDDEVLGRDIQPRVEVASQAPVSLPTKFDPWEQIPKVPFDFLGQKPSRLPLVSAFRASPTARAFDLLRTRLLHSLKTHGWKRVAVTSPSAGGGTTFCAVNLALSLARIPASRTVLMDLNFRTPGVAAALGIAPHGNMAEFLTGEVPIGQHLQRLSDTLVVGSNCAPDQNASEILHDPRTADVISALISDIGADTVLFDLPPVLEHDDVTAFLPQVDGVLLISDGDRTTAAELAACEKMLAGHAPLLGVVLNRAQQTDKTQVTP